MSKHQTVSEKEYLDEDIISFSYIIDIIQRRKWSIILCIILSVAGAVIFLSKAKSRYTSAAQILIDPGASSPGQEKDPLINKENFVIDSEVQLIRSNAVLNKNILAMEIKKPRVEEKSSMMTRVNNKPSMMALGKQWFKEKLQNIKGKQQEKQQINEVPSSPKLKNKIAQAKKIKGFRSGLKIKRQGLLYIVLITYTSENPEISEQRANMVTDSYLQDKKEYNSRRAKQWAKWYKNRLEKASKTASQAYHKAEVYRRKHGISKEGYSKISKKQLSDMGIRMITAKGEFAQAKQNYEGLVIEIKSKNYRAAIGESLRSAVVSRLRGQEADASLRVNALRRLGRRHQAYRKAITEQKTTRGLILREIKRYLRNYKAKYLAAKTKMVSLQNSIKSLESDYKRVSTKEGKYKQLISRANNLQKYHNTVLTRQEESNEGENPPSLGARIIQRATIPLAPNWPRKKIILFLALIIGIGVGVVQAFIREAASRSKIA